MNYRCNIFISPNKGIIQLLLLTMLLMYSMLCAVSAWAQPFAYVANQGSNNVSVIDTASNTVVTTIAPVPRACGVAITPDGTRAYVTNYGYTNTVTVIDIASNTIVDTVLGVGNDPCKIAMLPNGSRAYVANRISNSVSVIDTTNNTVVATVPTGTYPIGVDVTPDGTRVYVTNELSHNVVVIDTTSNNVVATIPGMNKPTGVAVTPDGTRAYVANRIQGQGPISVIDTQLNTVITTVDSGGSAPYEVTITPDGSHAYVTNQHSQNVTVIDTATNTVVAIITAGAAPVLMAFTPDGASAYVTNAGSGTVSVIDTSTFTVFNTITVGVLPIGVAVTPGLIVSIDIKPGSDPNCFNNNGHGVIPVAILGNNSFDATSVDASTVMLEGTSIKAVGKSDKLLAHIEDVNYDGYDDLIVQIIDEDGVFDNGDVTATLTGNLLPEFGSTAIKGTDNICIVP